MQSPFSASLMQDSAVQTYLRYLFPKPYSSASAASLPRLGNYLGKIPKYLKLPAPLLNVSASSNFSSNILLHNSHELEVALIAISTRVSKYFPSTRPQALLHTITFLLGAYHGR